MTNPPTELDITLEDWQAGDGTSPSNQISAKLKLHRDRVDLKFDDGRAIWIEQQSGTIRVHGYLPDSTGYDAPETLNIERARFIVGGTDADVVSSPVEANAASSAIAVVKSASPNLRNFLDLSTGHLREETTRLLSRDPGTFESETGYLVWVPGTYSDAEGYPDELLTILKAANGVADYVMFDRDAPTDDRFPIFDW